MASPASLPPNVEPAPALLSPHTPRAIRDARLDAERAEFEGRYAEEMEVAARALDLTGASASTLVSCSSHLHTGRTTNKFKATLRALVRRTQSWPSLVPSAGFKPATHGLGMVRQ